MTYRNLTRAAFTISMLASLALLLITARQTQGQVDADEQLPSGKWTLSADPYFGSDYRRLPVVVTSVTSDSARGLRITRVGLYNHSSKPIISVKLSWFLTTWDDTKTVLKQGQTPFITPSGGLPIAAEREVEFPVLSFGRVARTLVENGELNGRFRIQVVASEIQYEDGSSWARDGQATVAFKKAVYGASAMPTVQGSGSCAFQTCSAVAANGKVKYYVCVQSDIEQYCENHNTYCTNRICSGPVGP